MGPYICEKNEAGRHPQIPAQRTGKPFREQLLAPGHAALFIVTGYCAVSFRLWSTAGDKQNSKIDESHHPKFYN
jgi:hypothetical protein